MSRKCFGIDPVRNEAVQVEFGTVIDAVDDLIEQPAALPYLSPGFIDLQVNGYAGVDYNSPEASAEAIAQSFRVQFGCGVTRLLPTVITGPREHMAACLENLWRASRSIPEGVAVAGFHVEGPHICPDDGPRGAHPAGSVRKPDINEYQRWQEVTEGNIKLVTLAPEWEGATEYIERLSREGVVVAIGHTKATREQIRAAVDAGATLSTHIGNGAHAVLARHPNYLWEQLAEDRLAAGFIVDGIHIGAAFLKVALRAKGVDRAILVTDASAPAGAKPGRYQLGEQQVDLTADDRVVLVESGRLAGSALKMHRGVENLMRLAGLSLTEALTMATRNPARIGRIAGRERGLAPGQRSDFVLFHLRDGVIDIRETWIGGECFYRA